jgi:ribosomal-protein-alanine N-acetyltransferase
MTMDDLYSVFQIEKAANQFPWSQQNFTDSLDAGHHGWVYCDEYNTIMGYAVVQFILDEAHLLNICVDPDLQGRGFGRRILEHVIEHAKSRDSAIVVLEVRRSNKKAQNLYLQMGFNEMSVRRGYYPAQQGREDAILMGLDLDMMAIFSSQ